MFTHEDVSSGEYPWVIVERITTGKRGAWDGYALVDACDTLAGARAEKRALESDPQLCFTGKLEILYYVE